MVIMVLILVLVIMVLILVLTAVIMVPTRVILVAAVPLVISDHTTSNLIILLYYVKLRELMRFCGIPRTESMVKSH